MIKKLVVENAPNAPFLSRGIEVNGFIYTSGQINITSDGKLVEGTVAEKLEQVMRNLKAILEAGNANFGHVIKVIVYVTDIKMLPELNEAYIKYFSDPYPVREAVQVSALPLGGSIEISMVAYKE